MNRTLHTTLVGALLGATMLTACGGEPEPGTTTSTTDKASQGQTPVVTVTERRTVTLDPKQTQDPEQVDRIETVTETTTVTETVTEPAADQQADPTDEPTEDPTDDETNDGETDPAGQDPGAPEPVRSTMPAEGAPTEQD